MKIIFIFLLFTVNSYAQHWEFVEDLQGFITDIEIINGERYVAFKTGELWRGDSILHTYETQPGQETGLLSCVWWNGQVCVNVSSPDGIQRIICNEDTVLSVPYLAASTRHRGGKMLVDSSGVLYVGTGYGAIQGDAQDTSNLRGKLLSITDSTVNIFAIGLRNPWKMDIKGDTLYVADVGDHGEEEISRIDTSGLNLGWPCTEGSIVHDTTCGVTTGPFFTYPRANTGNAIIGGKWFHDAFWWCDNYYKFGGYIRDDSTWTKIPCPQYPDGMYVDGDSIYVYDYTGKIYRWTDDPLSLDSIPPKEEKKLLPIIVTSEEIIWNEDINGTMMVLTLEGQIVRYEETTIRGSMQISDLVPRMYVAVLMTPLGVEWRKLFIVW